MTAAEAYDLKKTIDPSTGALAYETADGGKLIWQTALGWRTFGADCLPAPAPMTARTFPTLEEAAEYATGYEYA